MKESGQYTVKQLSDLAGVSVRTLHYYDEIGLLKPSGVGQNTYRYYNDDSLFRLQQILFYREMGLELAQIKEILDAENFDRVSALQLHRQRLQEKIERLNTLIQTVDATIMHLVGEVNMTKKKIFEGFSEEKQKQYEEEATQMWGEGVRETAKLWNSYSEAKKQAILAEGGAIYSDIAANMDKGPESEEIQTLLIRWHDHLRNFYEPSIETLGGLGEMYHDHPDFNATFTAIHPALPGFLKTAIAHYVDMLETRWLERELGILEE
ncbi:MAG: MerR family transcriptional regulator [Anaerolineales bacterium]|nr:MerR family transcriptional regulator [Anaerolineales bacterium]